MYKSAALTLLVVGALTGCAVGPNYTGPKIPKPTTWRPASDTTASLADVTRWQLSQDPVLQQLIRTALEKNKDLRLAVARVAEARAPLGITRRLVQGHSTKADPFRSSVVSVTEEGLEVL